jgi:hypothetical protein
MTFSPYVLAQLERMQGEDAGRALLGILDTYAAHDDLTAPGDGLCPACRGAGCAACNYQTVPLPSLAGMPLPELQLGGDPTVLRDELLWEIREAIDNDPRTLQKSVGPSELGIECQRRLAYLLAGTPEVNVRKSPWLPTIGKATHAWAEEVFVRANRRYKDAARYLIETRVEVGALTMGGRLRPIRGSSDLYDRITGTVVDWKIVGDNTLKKVRQRKAPSDQYRAQAHLYGRGFMARGAYVERVAIFYLPRNGELTDAYFWAEDYDEKVALDVLARAQETQLVVDAAGPAAPGLLPTTDAYCTFCPFYRPNAADLTVACPGDPNRNSYVPPDARRSSSFEGII